MFAFGDSKEPLEATAQTVEDLLFDYIETLMREAVAGQARRGRWAVKDVLAALRKDPPKRARAEELLEKKDLQSWAESRSVIESSAGERLDARSGR